MTPLDLIIVLPGIMGSVLEDPAGSQVWPAQGCGLLMQFSDEDVGRLLADDLRSTDLIRSVSFKNVYRPLLRLLEQYGYRENGPRRPDGNLYAWHYDWRRDLRESARALAIFLEGILAARGDNIQITFVAHSMGGLVARTYLEARTFADHEVRPRVRRLFTLGTPHRGAPVALAHIMGKLGKLWLSAEQVQRVANDSRYPSLYQLLPPDDELYLWGQGGTHEPVSLTDDVAEELGLNGQSLRAMRDWRADLDPRRLDALRFFSFHGGTHDTVTSIWLRRDTPEVELTLQERPGAGDATVPVTSAALPSVQRYELEGEHGSIFQDDMVEAILPRLLGKTPRLAVSATGAVQLSCADPIVPRGGRVRGVIVLRHDALREKEFTGQLQIVPEPNWSWRDAQPVPQPAEPFRVQNIVSERLAFELAAPEQPGAYLVVMDLRYGTTDVQLKEPLGVRQDP